VFPEFDSPRFASSQDEAVSFGAWPGQQREAGAVFGGRLELNEDDDLDALARDD